MVWRFHPMNHKIRVETLPIKNQKSPMSPFKNDMRTHHIHGFVEWPRKPSSHSVPMTQRTL